MHQLALDRSQWSASRAEYVSRVDGEAAAIGA